MSISHTRNLLQRYLVSTHIPHFLWFYEISVYFLGLFFTRQFWTRTSRRYKQLSIKLMSSTMTTEQCSSKFWQEIILLLLLQSRMDSILMLIQQQCECKLIRIQVKMKTSYQQNLISLVFFSSINCHFLVDIGILGWQPKDKGFLVASPTMMLFVSFLEYYVTCIHEFLTW